MCAFVCVCTSDTRPTNKGPFIIPFGRLRGPYLETLGLTLRFVPLGDTIATLCGVRTATHTSWKNDSRLQALNPKHAHAHVNEACGISLWISCACDSNSQKQSKAGIWDAGFSGAVAVYIDEFKHSEKCCSYQVCSSYKKWWQEALCGNDLHTTFCVCTFSSHREFVMVRHCRT